MEAQKYDEMLALNNEIHTLAKISLVVSAINDSLTKSRLKELHESEVGSMMEICGHVFAAKSFIESARDEVDKKMSEWASRAGKFKAEDWKEFRGKT